MNRPIFLTIAGSDPIGGAGIQADLKTADRLGCYGCSVVTALTAQNSCGVSSIWPVDADKIEYQLLSILEDFTPDAVKIGMLPDISAVKSIGRILKTFNLRKIVLDPILAPTLGKGFSDKSLISVMYEELFPLSTLITPNLPEYYEITKTTGKNQEKLADAILIKGGHTGDDEIADHLILHNEKGKKEIILRHSRISTKNTHGSGCVLSSAIACRLAKGAELEESVREAVSFVASSFDKNKNLRFGKCGYGPTLI